MAKTYVNNEGNLILEIREEPLSAWLTIKKTGKIIGENEILALLEDAGIKCGFDEAVNYMRLHSLEKEFDVPFPVAMCNKQEVTSILHYNFNPDILSYPENGINIKTLEKLKVFRSGDIVAEYSCNIFTQSGSIYDIFGNLIDSGSVDTEQAKALAGDNIAYDIQNRQFIAIKDGFPYLDEQGCICLLDKVSLNGNEIPPEIQVKCPINMIIEGNVIYADIHCEADISVQGDVQSSTINCVKDLFITGDIISSNKKGIIVWGNLECRSIHNSCVLCRNDIHFTDNIENSTVVCDGEITGDWNNSAICGGLTQAGVAITVFQAGSYDQSKTEIEIALSPFYRNMLLLLTRELIYLKEDKELNATAIAELENRIEIYERALDEKLYQILKSEKQKLKKISVHDVSRPPIVFRILKHSYEVTKPEKGLEFEEKD